MKYLRLLTIAGSDSGGGAGIQADLKTFAALGGFGMSAITAITAQNTREVRRVLPVPPDVVHDQILAVLEDIGVDAVKTGMLHDADIVRTVCQCWTAAGSDAPLVVDPVAVASSGATLLDDMGLAALKTQLIPLARLITPNVDEAALLLELPRERLKTHTDILWAARQLLDLGCEAVLVKGGHLEGEIVFDVYAHRDGGVHTWQAPRVHTRNTHGTGCTLSSAITVGLGKGLPLQEAVAFGRAYILRALNSGASFELGHPQGHGPLNHNV